MSLTFSDTECMSSLDIYYVSLKPEAIKILKLCVFLIVIFLLGLLYLDFNQVLWHEETVCPVWHGNVLFEQPSQYLAPSKGCADLVFFWLLLWQNPQLFLPYV